jgi:hypothetical protein
MRIRVCGSPLQNRIEANKASLPSAWTASTLAEEHIPFAPAFPHPGPPLWHLSLGLPSGGYHRQLRELIRVKAVQVGEDWDNIAEQFLLIGSILLWP